MVAPLGTGPAADHRRGRRLGCARAGRLPASRSTCLQQQRLDQSVDESMTRELARFENGRRPTRRSTRRRHRCLRRAVPERCRHRRRRSSRSSTARPRFNPATDDHDALIADPAFVRAVDGLTDRGGGCRSSSPPRRARSGSRSAWSSDAHRHRRDRLLVLARRGACRARRHHADVRDRRRRSPSVVVAVGAYVVSGRLLRPIRDLRDTARDIGESDLTRRITATGNDDLTDLTVTFNEMLDRLDSAFSTQRQFLDDVGHELKTPITIVRGHLELMDSTDVDEVTATRELVLDEMDRMGRLVEELILLAKTRRPDFVHLEPTDLGALTDILLDKMRGLATATGRSTSARVAWVDADSAAADPGRSAAGGERRAAHRGRRRGRDRLASRRSTGAALGPRHRRGDRHRPAGADLRAVPPRNDRGRGQRPRAGDRPRDRPGARRRRSSWSPSPARCDVHDRVPAPRSRVA